MLINSAQEAITIVQKAIDRYETTDSLERNQLTDAFEYLKQRALEVDTAINQIEKILTNILLDPSVQLDMIQDVIWRVRL